VALAACLFEAPRLLEGKTGRVAEQIPIRRGMPGNPGRGGAWKTKFRLVKHVAIGLWIPPDGRYGTKHGEGLDLAGL
jgi:hypothetical protein